MNSSPKFVGGQDSLQRKVFNKLADKKWHCRSHEYGDVPSGQLAGGGGIQGLQRGTRKRPGYTIESANKYCDDCKKTTRWDRWTGDQHEPNAASGIPKKLQQRILDLYGQLDVIEQRKRPPHELTIDHRFPMQRWGAVEQRLDADMSEGEIRKTFQLLKREPGGNHNLLKSRACETCAQTKRRGTPFGIYFFYAGGPKWPDHVQTTGPEAEEGCIGCGWYDFDAWRTALNQRLEKR